MWETRSPDITFISVDPTALHGTDCHSKYQVCALYGSISVLTGMGPTVVRNSLNCRHSGKSFSHSPKTKKLLCIVVINPTVFHTNSTFLLTNQELAMNTKPSCQSQGTGENEWLGLFQNQVFRHSVYKTWSNRISSVLSFVFRVVSSTQTKLQN